MPPPNSKPKAAVPRPRGRLTKRQRQALERLAALYVVDPEPHQWPQVFGRDAPMGLEIGFGMGQATLAWAASRADMNLVGIEIYPPGIGALLLGMEQEGLENLRVLEGDAAALLAEKFAPDALQEVRIWFPDPWPKRRHHKRRLVQPEFAAQLASKLQPGGKLLLATDSADYAAWMEKVLGAVTTLRRTAPSGNRPSTRFASRGLRLGHQIADLAFQKR